MQTDKSRYSGMMKFYQLEHCVIRGEKSGYRPSKLRCQAYLRPENHKIKVDSERTSDAINTPPSISSSDLLKRKTLEECNPITDHAISCKCRLGRACKQLRR